MMNCRRMYPPSPVMLCRGCQCGTNCNFCAWERDGIHPPKYYWTVGDHIDIVFLHCIYCVLAVSVWSNSCNYITMPTARKIHFVGSSINGVPVKTVYVLSFFFLRNRRPLSTDGVNCLWL
ncbi:hypothetical protein V8B97DRAFT_1482272 [Scleroderma yunnanense]